MRRAVRICWGYAVEVLLAAFAYALLVYFVGPDTVADFLSRTWIAWSTICGIILAAAVAMFVLVVQMLTSEFGGYLVSRSADGTFRKAFGVAIAYSFLGTAGFVVAGNVPWPAAIHAAGFMLVLVVINLYTMVVNVINLQRMHALFERIRRRMDHPE